MNLFEFIFFVLMITLASMFNMFILIIHHHHIHEYVDHTQVYLHVRRVHKFD